MNTQTAQPPTTDVREITACRLCGATALWPFFSLGDQPLANDLVAPDQLDRVDFRAPLTVVRCDACGHVQLLHTVSPARLYTDYRFQSGVAPGWHQHCADLATRDSPITGHGFVVDIGSNDGTLLTKFRDRGWRVLGVDPAANLARAAPVNTECCEFDSYQADRLTDSYGHADLIVAQNVLGHVDDPVDFLRGVNTLLAPTGELIIEVPDLRRLIATHAFDTIYHEHLSYWSIFALQGAAARAGLEVAACGALPLHGGSLRVILRHDHIQSTPWDFGDDELGTRTPFATFQSHVEDHLDAIRELWAEATPPIWGYGASAKATVLLNALGRAPERIVDDTPGKQGYYVPGVRVPITGPADMATAGTIVLFSWNWAEELKRRARAAGFAGEFLLPWPDPVLV